MSIRSRRRTGPLVLAGGLAALLSGCGPDSLGLTGMSVAADGSPVIVMAVCRGYIVSSGILDAGRDGKAHRSAGDWTSRRPVGRGVTQLPVAAPPAGWVQHRPARPLVAGMQ